MREEDHESMDVYALYGNSLANNEKMEETEKQLIRRQLFFIQSIFTLFNQEIGDAVVIVVIDIKFKTKYISTIISTIVTKKMCLRNAVQTGFFDCIEDFAKNSVDFTQHDLSFWVNSR